MAKRRFLIGALAICTALPVMAQPRRGQGEGGRRLNYMAGYLGLSDSQKDQAKAIFDAAAASAETVMGQLKAAREALNQAVKEGQSDAQIDQLAAAVGVSEGQLAGIRAKASAKFYALLTDEQKAKFDEMKLGRRGGGRRGRGGN